MKTRDAFRTSVAIAGALIVVNIPTLWNGTMVAPRMMQDIHPALYPNMWKNGLTIR